MSYYSSKLIIIALFVIAIISVIAYILIYNIRINKRIQSGEGSGKKWPVPRSIVIYIGAIILVIVVCMNIFSNDNKVEPNNTNYVYDYKKYTAETIIGTEHEQYVKAYEELKLSGYEMYKKEENDMRYVYFISETGYDTLHPSFILFVEYIGDKQIEAYTYETKVHLTEESKVTSGGGDMKATKYYCIVGNMNFDYINGFGFEMSVYDDLGQLEEVKKEEGGNPQPVSSIDVWIGK